MEKLNWSLNKVVLPQHVDHAGVMWHGTYLNWLEEARIDSLQKVGIKYSELIKRGYEMPVREINIKYKLPIFIGEKIEIQSVFRINKKPFITIESKFYNKHKKLMTKSTINIVLIDKANFSIVKKRPLFIEDALEKLSKRSDNLLKDL